MSNDKPDSGTPRERISRRDFIRTGATAGLGATALAGFTRDGLTAQEAGQRWDRTADVLIIGAGVSGLAAAVSALDHGASVLMIEANFDIGGRGMVSGGNVHLGGGNSRQRRHGVEDSADQVFEDWIRHDHRVSRYSDRDLVRVFADENAATFEWLIENGVEFHDQLTGPGSASTVPRQGRTLQWPVYEQLITSHPTRMGSGLVRALERSAREKGAEILLRHRMTSLVRETSTSGRVLGITAVHEGQELRFRGTKGVLIATGGHRDNVDFRRTFDPRMTEEYQTAGSPYCVANADGELAAMAIGAALWAVANQTIEFDPASPRKAAHIGCRYGYASLHWQPDSPIFDQVGASGLTGVDWESIILVKQTGVRFCNESASGHDDFFSPALSYSGDPNKRNGGGPIWAIFDAETVSRQRWDPTPPNVDPNGYFFSADTLGELARGIRNPYQTMRMEAATLQATVERYNSFVQLGTDEDFGKPSLRYRIETPPFYAAWSTPLVHDSLTGLRTDSRSRVIDRYGEVITGLYCSGESQGGFAQHGLGRCLVFGRIAGRDAALHG